jgi:glycosyltransferase involved in cell wall biosynthesis
MNCTSSIAEDDVSLSDKVELSIIVPAFREGLNLTMAIGQIRSCALMATRSIEVIVVDDGSDDDTWSCIHLLSSKFSDVRGIRFSRNYGKDAAVAAGLNESTGDAAIIIDADLQHPPALIPLFYEQWKIHGHPIVAAVKRKCGDEPLLRRLASRLFNDLVVRITSLDLRNSTDCKLLARPVITAWKNLGEYRLFFRGMVDWLGFKQVTIPFDVVPSLRRTSTWSSLKLMQLATHSLISYSSMPLRIAHIISGLFLLFSVILGADALFMRLTGRAFTGFTTVIILILLTGGLQLGVLAVIAEYLAAIYEEVKRRPRYVITERASSILPTACHPAGNLWPSTRACPSP